MFYADWKKPDPPCMNPLHLPEILEQGRLISFLVVEIRTIVASRE